jgi:hypothetical protein
MRGGGMLADGMGWDWGYRWDGMGGMGLEGM